MSSTVVTLLPSYGTRVLTARVSSSRLLSRRSYATTTAEVIAPTTSDAFVPLKATRAPKKSGTIEDIFSSSLSETPALPQRFSDLKKSLYRENLVASWNEVLEELKVVTDEVASLGQEAIPRVEYADLMNGLSGEQTQAIKRAGSVIVKGGVPKEEALAWKQGVREYAAANRELVKGSPADKIVFYELYYSKPQIAARTHPALINTQKALLGLWHTSDPTTPVSLSTPISYTDRLRIRPPGPSVFTLGPHIDGGGLERWEDPGFRSCFKEILNGNWRKHDPFDVSPRLGAKQDLYNASSQCSVLRPWQGWTSLSTTGPREGTLRLLPFLSLSTAYIMLRPFFRPKIFARNGEVSLAAEDWEVDLESTAFPGSEMAKAQGLNEKTHPHLRLDKTMISIPRVEPGDQVYWHCDLVHAVEAEHTGTGDSSVFYIPSIPLTADNFSYLRDQAAHFYQGIPPPDFGGGEGESNFKGRAVPADITSIEARRFSGLAPFEVPSNATPGEAGLIKQVNAQFA